MEENTLSNNSSTSDAKNVSDGSSSNGTGLKERPFIGWSQFKSKDEEKPDVLEVKAQSTTTYPTEYGECTDVSHNDGGVWREEILTLKYNKSLNQSLFWQWTDALKNGKLRVGKAVKIRTWMGTSKNDHPIRRFKLVM